MPVRTATGSPPATGAEQPGRLTGLFPTCYGNEVFATSHVGRDGDLLALEACILSGSDYCAKG
jgi:hypothetical protein